MEKVYNCGAIWQSRERDSQRERDYFGRGLGIFGKGHENLHDSPTKPTWFRQLDDVVVHQRQDGVFVQKVQRNSHGIRSDLYWHRFDAVTSSHLLEFRAGHHGVCGRTHVCLELFQQSVQSCRKMSPSIIETFLLIFSIVYTLVSFHQGNWNDIEYTEWV